MKIKVKYKLERKEQTFDLNSFGEGEYQDKKWSELSYREKERIKLGIRRSHWIDIEITEEN